MKIALVHDYLKEYGGAERVLEALHDIYPNADVYTSVYIPSYLGPHRERFRNWKIHTSFLQWIPFKAKLISPIRLLSPFAFRQFDFSSYDVVIVSATGAYFPNTIRTKTNHKSSAISHKPIHICYCHTPPRYLYGYATAREWKSNRILNVIGSVMNHFLRMVDYNASKNVDHYIANSEEVKKRIEKFYRRDSVVIYPPVEVNSKSPARHLLLQKASAGGETRNSKQISNIKYPISKQDYYLTGGRLARAKHMDLIVKACIELGAPLKVFGKGFAGYEEELRDLANGEWQMANGKDESGVQFVGEVTDQEKLELMRNAKAFLFASEDEDFGITPVEAMGQGLPVIAYYSGGVKETVVDQVTGLFFHELKVESLKVAIKEFEKRKWSREECIKRAKEFSEDIFKKKISAFVASSK